MISGVNEGQTVSIVINLISGTVGAAKTAAGNGIPAPASSQGLPEPGGELDYPAGADAVFAWLGDRRAARVAKTAAAEADSTNVHSCNGGSVRGTISDLPLASSTQGELDLQNCESTF